MAQYKAPDQDGTFVSDPGRENPIYRETESLLILSEFEAAKKADEDEEDPFRPPDHPSYTDRRRAPPPPQQVGSSMVPYDDYNAKARTPLGLQPDDSDSDDDLMFEEDRLANYEEKPAARDEDSETGDKSEFRDEGEEPEEGKREWKYSTAGIKQHGICFKYCCILLFFIIVMLIFMGISMLFNKLFFADPGPAPPPDYIKRPDNSTFPENKDKIDSVCNNNMMEVDRGVRCREYCEPQYDACCDAFPFYETYNHTTIFDALNTTAPPTYDLTDDEDILNLKNCEFTDNLRGCSSYAKCFAVKGAFDPAPGALHNLCSPEQLAVSPDRCQAACQNVQCCFSENGQSCVVDILDTCFDYSPCQNLRKRIDNPGVIVHAAPIDLDRLCLWKRDECEIACEKARCCLDENSRCFQENFVTCLGYAACEDHAVNWNMTVPPMYSFLPRAPAEIIYACGAREPENDQVENAVQPDSCPDYCDQAVCCYQNHPADNCFRKDPLGCMAWHRYCQSGSEAVSNWYAGQYILPSPP